MAYINAFSPDYNTARQRFRALASGLGCRLERYAIDRLAPNGDDLTIDAAILGAHYPQSVAIISSGLHGVEGFLGSAVQVALLESQLLGWTPPPNTALVLLHALNPYGFAWVRRCNEDNADLNRNFLLPGEVYRGSPEKYAQFDRFFNPPGAPIAGELFTLKALALMLRYGLTALKQTLPVGQYDFPKGLFYGGDRPSQTYQILAAHLPKWIGEARHVLHLDFHTGLGKQGTYKLLVGESTPPDRVRWTQEQFGTDVVEVSQPKGTSYQTRGNLGHWCRNMFPQHGYDFLLAELGSYPLLDVVAALRAENQAHWWDTPDRLSYQHAKQRLMEAFVPSNPLWRETAVRQGLELVQRVFELIEN
jgi:hypothetical protein